MSRQYIQWRNTELHNTHFQNTQCVKIFYTKVHLMWFKYKKLQLGNKPKVRYQEKCKRNKCSITIMKLFMDKCKWNRFSAKVTTNAVECWRLGVTFIFHGIHFCIGTSLENILFVEADQNFTVTKVFVERRGTEKKCWVLSKNVENIANSFKTDYVVPYLRSLAYYTHSWTAI